METKYKKGEVVSERIRPALKLVIRRFHDGIYYCEVQENRTRKELVYFERELMASPQLSNV